MPLETCGTVSQVTTRWGPAARSAWYASVANRACTPMHTGGGNPTLRTLEVFLLRDGRWSLEHVYQEDDEVRAVPFDAIAFPLADLWS